MIDMIDYSARKARSGVYESGVDFDMSFYPFIFHLGVINWNGKNIKDLSNNLYGTFDYVFVDSESHVYNVSLILVTLNGSILLDYDSFNVVVHVSGDDAYFAGLSYVQFMFLVGLIPVLLFTVITVLISQKVHNERVGVLLVGLGSLSGVCCSMVFGLWELYVGFLICLFIVAVRILPLVVDLL